MSHHAKLYLSLLLVSLAASLASAQMATGNIAGQVEDSTGAVIPHARITITHIATQQVRTVSTNERGEFLAPLLVIGEYEVSAEFAGFKRATVSNLRLLVDQTLNLDIKLDPGSTTETVNVQSTAPLL